MRNWVHSLVILAFLAPFAWSEDDQWQGFDFQDAGITAAEFDKVKASGMSRKRLEELLEYGIMPSEYFSEPWKKLGVSEASWINSKKQGMEDADIDRTLYTSQRFNWMPVTSFFLPGYYHYKTGRYKMGGLLSALAVTGLVLTFVDMDETATGSNTEQKRRVKLHWPILAFGAAVWSSFDAYRGTRYSHYRDAERFTLDIIPSKEPKVEFSVRF